MLTAWLAQRPTKAEAQDEGAAKILVFFLDHLPEIIHSWFSLDERKREKTFHLDRQKTPPRLSVKNC